MISGSVSGARSDQASHLAQPRQPRDETGHGNVGTIHDRIIDLYRYLATHAEVSSSEELLNSLLALEQHEAMRMVRDAEELEDL